MKKTSNTANVMKYREQFFTQYCSFISFCIVHKHNWKYKYENVLFLMIKQTCLCLAQRNDAVYDRQGAAGSFDLKTDSLGDDEQTRSMCLNSSCDVCVLREGTSEVYVYTDTTAQSHVCFFSSMRIKRPKGIKCINRS